LLGASFGADKIRDPSLGAWEARGFTFLQQFPDVIPDFDFASHENKLQAKDGREKTRWQVYCRLYYGSRLLPSVQSPVD
jgi:hypothetical protein